jgi:hypothetical protein
MQPVAVAIATEVTANKQVIPWSKFSLPCVGSDMDLFPTKDGNQIYIIELN